MMKHPLLGFLLVLSSSLGLAAGGTGTVGRFAIVTKFDLEFLKQATLENEQLQFQGDNTDMVIKPISYDEESVIGVDGDNNTWQFFSVENGPVALESNQIYDLCQSDISYK